MPYYEIVIEETSPNQFHANTYKCIINMCNITKQQMTIKARVNNLLPLNWRPVKPTMSLDIWRYKQPRKFLPYVEPPCQNERGKYHCPKQ